MRLQMIGCSHHTATVELRERLAFSPDQARQALAGLRQRFPRSETVLLSTCNRVELYLAAQDAVGCPSHQELVDFFADFHGLEVSDIFTDLFERTGEDTVRHLFTVASALDSMVVGEAQILSQVKQAYELAREGDTAGTILHSVFQAANRAAKRVATETSINERRVSIPSVAVADYAKQFFETFKDKKILVVGAGEMGKETLRYLIDEGACQISIVNRTQQRADALSAEAGGEAKPWDQLPDLLVEADIVISTTGADRPIITARDFEQLHRRRYQRMLFILDLAVPRDFDSAINEFTGVYLYSIDDLSVACERNKIARQREWPKAESIIEDETSRFMTELNHRATGPTIKRLTARANEVKVEELERLFNKLDDLDEQQRREVERFAGRLVNKLLHPPLESLRDEAEQGAPHGLLEALKKLFQLRE